MHAEFDLVAQTAERIFKDLAAPQDIIRVGGDGWRQPLWRALEDAGLPTCWAPEALGGQGLALSEGFAILRCVGRAALPAALPDTMIAAWALGQAGLQVPAGAMALVVPEGSSPRSVDSTGFVRAHARKIPFASTAEHIVVVARADDATQIALVPAGQCTISRGSSLGGDPLDDVVIDGPAPWFAEANPDMADAVMLLGAVSRSLQMAGALETMLEMSVAYSQQRVAFEKPIARFQAVQHSLARLGGEVAAALSAAASAADAFTALAPGSEALLLEVASAKVRSGEAVEAASAIAHQVHGAIGYTTEHVLHRYSMRALSWRDEYGSETYWARRLGERICAQSSADLWRLLASR